MKELRFDNLYNVEYYHEIPDYDSRIAIMKFLDARETMGYAKLSLSYAQTQIICDREKNIIRAVHIRHAITDLNNSFDLLLQIPWMFYRAWESFNSSGNLVTRENKNKNNIIRNNDGWVHKAEKECTYAKVILFLKYKDNNNLMLKLETFHNKFIYNNSKPFTVRTLCNTMKHNRVLSFKELYEPYSFNIKTPSRNINLREANLSMEYSQEFYDMDKPETALGKIEVIYNHDLSIDIEYYNNDKFSFKDCTHNADMHNLEEVVQECISYYNSLVELFEHIYSDIYSQIIPSLNIIPNINRSNDNIDLNKYFIPIN